MQQLTSAEREGGRVSVNVRVADLDLLPQGRIDDRKMEVSSRWTSSIPRRATSSGCNPLLVSPVRGDGSARRQCGHHDGTALQEARRKKEHTYPELARPRGGRARLVVLGCEIGGRWSDEARDFVSQLPKAKSAGNPSNCELSVRHAWFRRWSTLLACSAAGSFGLSLPEHCGGFGVDGESPPQPQPCLKSSDKSVWTVECAFAGCE